MLSAYPACFFEEKNGAYSVIFPDLELATCGDNLNQALEMSMDCLAGFLYTAKQSGDTVPSPSDISSINLKKIAQDLDASDDRGFTTLVAIDVEEYARKHFNKAVKKTLSIPAWLDKSAKAQNINFSEVLQVALKQRLGL